MNTRERLLSLDVFRGATVAAMILVNNPGSWAHIYPPLRHAEWNGCTPTDLVFPFFLFIVGVSITFAMQSKKADRTQHNKLLWKAGKRALILFGLGLFLAVFPRVFTEPLSVWSNVRIPGVLQRIALVYLVAVFIYVKSSDRKIVWVGIALLLFYWVLMKFVPVPGIGPANLEKASNLGAWLDRAILTEAHLWKSSKTWDPEGILSTIPAVVTTIMGILTGSFIRRKDLDSPTKVSWLLTAGVIAVIAGLVWDLHFPLNKSLWTSSFVLYTGGWALLLFGICYWLIDVQGYRKYTTFFVVYGMNAITVFFLSGLIPRILGMIKVDVGNGESVGLQTWLYQSYITPYFSPMNASLLYALLFISAWFCILWVMYKRQIFIKV